jgi:hypothetical protein
MSQEKLHCFVINSNFRKLHRVKREGFNLGQQREAIKVLQVVPAPVGYILPLSFSLHCEPIFIVARYIITQHHL